MKKHISLISMDKNPLPFWGITLEDFVFLKPKRSTKSYVFFSRATWLAKKSYVFFSRATLLAKKCYVFFL
jgi:hypothetical protein